MKISVIVNRAAGQSRRALTDKDFLAVLFEKAGLDARIYAIHPSEFGKTLDYILDQAPEAVCVAGGDGTVNAAAGKLAGTDIPLAVLPGGTLNHFTTDAGIPPRIEDAVNLIAGSRPRRIDVGEVNGHVFINNSSVGLYPRAVRLRSRYLHRLGGRKWLAMLIAAISVFKRFPLFEAEINTDDNQRHLRTPFVFVGNNQYELDLFRLGSRSTFTGGTLSLYTAGCQDRLGILRLVLNTLLNRLKQDTDFSLNYVKAARLETGKSPVRVAMDGEIRKLTPPLLYKIRPRDLAVFLPGGKEAP